MSYGDNDGLTAHWAAMGYSVDGLDAAQMDQLRQVGSVFVDGLGWRETGNGIRTPLFPGVPADPDQARAWPRSGASDVYGRDIAADAVPGCVLRATYEAAQYAHLNPGALNEAYLPQEQVQSEGVGSLRQTFFEPKAAAGQPPSKPIIPNVMDALAPVLVGGDNPHGLTMVMG